MKSLKHVARLSLVALITLVVFSACKKERDTIAKVKVIEETDGVTPVVGATVMLTSNNIDPDSIRTGLEMESTTNGAGEVSFNYSDLFREGQAGLFVLDINVEMNGEQASGIIKVVENETSEATVFIDIP